MYPNSYMQNFLTQAKKDIASIFEKKIEFFVHVLRLKGITKFNMIMI